MLGEKTAHLHTPCSSAGSDKHTSLLPLYPPPPPSSLHSSLPPFTSSLHFLPSSLPVHTAPVLPVVTSVSPSALACVSSDAPWNPVGLGGGGGGREGRGEEGRKRRRGRGGRKGKGEEGGTPIAYTIP